MGAVRHTKTSVGLAVMLGFAALACGERPASKKPDVTAADVISGSVQAFDHYESAEGKFGLDFPPVWKDHYTALAHSDTAFGSRGIIEFRFKGDPAWKVEPKTLLAIRIFTPAAWAKVMTNPKQTVGVKLKERGNDVFVLSLAGSNPYPTGSPPAALFDQMMIAAMHDINPARLTLR